MALLDDTAPVAPLEVLFNNISAQATADVAAAIAAEQAANAAIYLPDASAWVAISAGWTLGVAQVVYTPTTVQWRLQVTRTGGTIAAVSPSGNIANTEILTIVAEQATFRPLLQASLSTLSSGPNGSYIVETDGTVKITATANAAINDTDTLNFGGTYLRAV